MKISALAILYSVSVVSSAQLDGELNHEVVSKLQRSVSSSSFPSGEDIEFAREHSTEAKAALEPMLRGQDSGAKQKALTILAALPEDGSNYVVQAINSQDSFLRECGIAIGLRTWPRSPEVAEAFANKIKNTSNAGEVANLLRVSEKAITAFPIKQREDLRVTMETIATGDPKSPSTSAAILALTRYKDARANGFIRKLAEGRSQEIKSDANSDDIAISLNIGLAVAGDRSAEERLAKVLADKASNLETRIYLADLVRQYSVDGRLIHQALSDLLRDTTPDEQRRQVEGVPFDGEASAAELEYQLIQMAAKTLASPYHIEVSERKDHTLSPTDIMLIKATVTARLSAANP